MQIQLLAKIKLYFFDSDFDSPVQNYLGRLRTEKVVGLNKSSSCAIRIIKIIKTYTT